MTAKKKPLDLAAISAFLKSVTHPSQYPDYLLSVCEELTAEVESLRDRNARLEKVHVLHYGECFVCKASLEPPDYPPHCTDCQVTDDALRDWEAAIAAELDAAKAWVARYANNLKQEPSDATHIQAKGVSLKQEARAARCCECGAVAECCDAGDHYCVEHCSNCSKMSLPEEAQRNPAPPGTTSLTDRGSKESVPVRGPLWRADCVTTEFTSRRCVRGTNGCHVDHSATTAKEAVDIHEPLSAGQPDPAPLHCVRTSWCLMPNGHMGVCGCEHPKTIVVFIDGTTCLDCGAVLKRAEWDERLDAAQAQKENKEVTHGAASAASKSSAYPVSPVVVSDTPSGTGETSNPPRELWPLQFDCDGTLYDVVKESKDAAEYLASELIAKGAFRDGITLRVVGPYVLATPGKTDEERLPNDLATGLPLRIEREGVLRLLATVRAEERAAVAKAIRAHVPDLNASANRAEAMESLREALARIVEGGAP